MGYHGQYQNGHLLPNIDAPGLTTRSDRTVLGAPGIATKETTKPLRSLHSVSRLLHSSRHGRFVGTLLPVARDDSDVPKVANVGDFCCTVSCGQDPVRGNEST